MKKEVYRREYAVEIRKKLDNESTKFLEQVDVFYSVEDAETCKKEYNEPLSNNEFIDIICIEYDANDNEIGFYSIY